MCLRKLVLCGFALVVLALPLGCNSKDDKVPKAETTPGTKTLQPMKAGAGGGPGPAGAQPQ